MDQNTQKVQNGRILMGHDIIIREFSAKMPFSLFYTKTMENETKITCVRCYVPFMYDGRIGTVFELMA